MRSGHARRHIELHVYLRTNLIPAEPAIINPPSKPISGKMLPVLGSAAGDGCTTACSTTATSSTTTIIGCAAGGGGGGGGAWPVTLACCATTVSGTSLMTVAV